jgi:hypothetical protein
MILNALTDLESLCGHSPPFLFPNKLRPIKYKQNETESDFMLHTKLSVVKELPLSQHSSDARITLIIHTNLLHSPNSNRIW